MNFKFGDIIHNKSAGKGNPNRVILVLNVVFDKIFCISKYGKYVIFSKKENDADNFLQLVGKIDVSPFVNLEL